MKFILLLSLLKVYLANCSTNEEIHPPDIKERILTQPSTIRKFILSENQRRKFVNSNAAKVPGLEIDAARADRSVNLRILHPSDSEYLPRKLVSTRVSQKIKKAAASPRSNYAVMKIQSTLQPTNYIRLQGKNELAGPEGKIIEVLAQSINTSLVINEKQPKGLALNLQPITRYGSWSLVYHPYRKLPLVPVIHSSSTTEAQVTFCLLTMLTIMIIMLMQVMRNLIKIHDIKSEDALEFLKCITLPKGLMGGVESFFYICLAFTFFVNLGIILEIIFREKYGKNTFEKIQTVEDIDKLNLTPIFSTKECLRELVINRSKKVYCIVSEDFGKEVIRRYGNDGKCNMIRLVDSFYFKFEWRGLHLDSNRHLERFNDVQLKLLQSGLLQKWYEDEMMLNLGDEEKYMRQVRTTWSSRNRDKSVRLRKFIYFLVLLVFNGCMLAFLMFIAEHFMLRTCFESVKERYLQKN